MDINVFKKIKYNLILNEQNLYEQDGVFAKRNIRKGELISYYSGVIFNQDTDPIFFRNQTDEEL